MTFGSAADGLLAAIVAVLGSLFTWWLTNRRSGERLKTAYQRQWEKASSELRRSYESQIEYLKGQLAAAQQAREADARESAREIARLNRLLNRRGPTPGGGGSD